MKLLPVFYNVPWTKEYKDVLKFWGVNKFDYLSNNYLKNATTDWSEAKLQGNIVNTDRINAKVTMNVDNLPASYANWTLYDFLAVNYILSDKGQYFFVTTATTKGQNQVTYELELDSWMTNVETKISNDNVIREINRGHADRIILKSGTTDKYQYDFNLANPNWNPINTDNPKKDLIGKQMFIPNASVLDNDGTTNQDIDTSYGSSTFSFLGDIEYMVAFRTTSNQTEFLNVEIGNKNYKLPFIAYICPLNTDMMINNDEWNRTNFMKWVSDKAGEIAGVYIVKGSNLQIFNLSRPFKIKNSSGIFTDIQIPAKVYLFKLTEIKTMELLKLKTSKQENKVINYLKIEIIYITHEKYFMVMK